MIINIEECKQRKMKKTRKTVKVPVYSKVYMDGNKLIGEFEGSKRKVVIKTYKED